MPLLVPTGELSLRMEERTLPELSPQEPPRNTRYVPDPGPVGFVWGADV